MRWDEVLPAMSHFIRNSPFEGGVGGTSAQKPRHGGAGIHIPRQQVKEKYVFLKNL